MRFDILLAAISSGIYAPLALMAGGFLLAVGGIVFLLWRRKKKAKPVLHAEETVTPVSGDSEPVPVSEPELASAPAASEQPAPKEGRRRRSLVGGAERETGTPAGEDFAQGDDSQDPSEPGLETTGAQDAEFEEYDGDHEAADHETHYEYQSSEEQSVEALADFDELDAEEADIDLDPEWIEPSDQEADQETDDAFTMETAAAAIAAGTAASTGAIAAQQAIPRDGEIEADALDLGNETEAYPDIAADVEPAISGEEVKTPPSAEIAAARKRPIVFRQFMPRSPQEDGLSFFGGQPIGPSDFQWPRERAAQGGSPLQFVMQWDCSQLSQEDPTGLLPQDGVLYCFINNDHDGEENFLASHAFLHHRGAVSSWVPIAVPDDAGPALGKHGAFELSGCTKFVDDAQSYAPRILPRFPFAAISFEYPAENEGTHEDGGLMWSDNHAADALLEVQKSGVAVTQAAIEGENAHHALNRPFPAFPHDFGAIRVLASRMIESLNAPDATLAEAFYPNLSEDQREEQFAEWANEAKEIYLLGIQRPQDQKLDQAIADDIWQWFEERGGILGDGALALYEEAVDLSLGVGSEALGNVPAHWIDKAMSSHALATEQQLPDVEGEAQIRATTPARMFGPPSDLSLSAKALANEHILLLELPKGAGPQHHFRAQVLQYWITPDDLAAGKFDQVRAIVSKA